METNEKIMTGEESLKIITDMISMTKVNFSQSIFHFLLWGWLILICTLSEYILSRFTSYPTPWYVWFLTIPGVFASMIYGFVKGRQSKVFTYGDMLSMWTWLGFLVTMIILFVLSYKNLENIGPFVMMLAGLPTFISGFIIKFKPFVYGGISMWLLSLIAGFSGPEIAPFAESAAMITGYLIPVYLLRNRIIHGTI